MIKRLSVLVAFSLLLRLVHYSASLLGLGLPGDDDPEVYITRPGDLVMPDPFGHFLDRFGPYWTDLDMFGPFCLIGQV